MIPNLFAKSVTVEQVIPHLDPAFGDQLVLWLRAIELMYVDGKEYPNHREHRLARSLALKAALLLAKRREQEKING
jgi:hypothetical protein